MTEGLYNLKINEQALVGVATNSPRYDAYVATIGAKYIEEAKAIFRRRRKTSQRNRSETSPPAYIESFFVRKVGKDWWFGNSDPGALWVEFGAHAGGKTFVLKYRPLGLALDAIALEQ